MQRQPALPAGQLARILIHRGRFGNGTWIDSISAICQGTVSSGEDDVAVKPIRPTFKRPPLLEQAITVMFEPLDRFSIGDYGLFWTRIRDRFPECDTQEPLQNIIEADTFRPTELQIRLLQGNTLPRCAYYSADGSEVVQLQNDRFSFNWRGETGKPYPRSEATMARFKELFTEFSAFVVEREFGEIAVVQCELVNVNIVPVADFGKSFADAPMVFSLGAGLELDFLQTESYITNTRHLIVGDEGPIGRLYVALLPVLRVDDNTQAYRLELTARGLPSPGAEGFEVFFEAARNSLNAGFLASTTEWAHSKWGLNDE